MKIPRRIQQIMPAEGWAAEIITEGELTTIPLVGWALVQDGTEVIVVGLVPGRQVEYADEQEGFDGYAYIPSMAADAMEELLADELEEDDEDDDATPRRSRLN